MTYRLDPLPCTVRQDEQRDTAPPARRRRPRVLRLLRVLLRPRRLTDAQHRAMQSW